MEALGLVRTLDDFDRPFTRSGDRITKFVPCIPAIGEDMAQPRKASAHRLQDIDGTIAILDIGCMHEDEYQEATCVCQDMSLTALDLFTCVIVARTATFCRFHRLAVNHARIR